MGIPVHTLFFFIPWNNVHPFGLYKNGIKNRQVAALEDKKRRQIAAAKREAASAESGSQSLRTRVFWNNGVRDDSWMHIQYVLVICFKIHGMCMYLICFSVFLLNTEALNYGGDMSHIESTDELKLACFVLCWLFCFCFFFFRRSFCRGATVSPLHFHSYKRELALASIQQSSRWCIFLLQLLDSIGFI